MQYLKEDIQEKILHIAEEVFSEKGYKDASMREIASRTGITVSNIYHYFTNQQESVQEYIDLVSEHRARLRMLLFQA